jgi:hypothetical protein
MEYGKYKFHIGTGYAGATHEEEWDITKDWTGEEWEAMSEKEQEAALQSYLDDFVSDRIDCRFEFVEGSDAKN